MLPPIEIAKVPSCLEGTQLPVQASTDPIEPVRSTGGTSQLLVALGSSATDRRLKVSPSTSCSGSARPNRFKGSSKGAQGKHRGSRGGALREQMAETGPSARPKWRYY